MEIKKLIASLNGKCKFEIIGPTSGSIAHVTLDSRKVGKDTLFAAIKGSKVDGHQYIAGAIAQGASVIIMQTQPDTKNEGVCYLITDDTSTLFAHAAFGFYEIDPELKVIGVTGTNGKTTVATLLYQTLRQLGYKCGLISTVENKIEEEVIPATHTTPDAGALASLMYKMQQAECDYILMEVSSHALDQGRVAAVPFIGAVFTNITHDHLDYHVTFLNYIRAKKKFFDMLAPHAFCMVNSDDKNGKIMVESTAGKVKFYSCRAVTDYRAKVVTMGTNGLQLQFNGQEFFTPLVGEFNAYNLLAVYGVAMELGQDSTEVLLALSAVPGAEGRMEQVVNANINIKGIVDYAHTPDALDNVITTLTKAMQSGQKLITVVGCGGDRDKTKRPEMARIASKGSQLVVFTSDNPRSEDPNAIITDMLAGLDETEKAKALIITDRTQAIRTAVMMAQHNDVVLIAGKGHEKYQEINGEKLPFEDKKVLAAALAAKT